MTEHGREDVAETRGRGDAGTGFSPRLRVSVSPRPFFCALPALLISAAATAWCWWATRGGLGLFLGTTLLITLCTPALVLAESFRGRWIAAVALAAGAALVWAISTTSVDVTGLEWLRCTLVLAAYVWALAGVASIFAAARWSLPVASGITVLLGLLWLTWPVWLSPWLTQGLTDWLVPANPMMAINAVLKHFGTWDRAPLAYRALTVLNQDVPYHLPTGILPAVLVHLIIGSPGMALSAGVRPMKCKAMKPNQSM